MLKYAQYYKNGHSRRDDGFFYLSGGLHCLFFGVQTRPGALSFPEIEPIAEGYLVTQWSRDGSTGNTSHSGNIDDKSELVAP